jgi:hypothetical protein
MTYHPAAAEMSAHNERMFLVVRKTPSPLPDFIIRNFYRPRLLRCSQVARHPHSPTRGAPFSWRKWMKIDDGWFYKPGVQSFGGLQSGSGAIAP